MEDSETRNHKGFSDFSELRGEVDGMWNKVKLTSRYIAAFIGYTASEYIENAIAVTGNTDPASYSAEREQRHEQVLAKLGEWAVDRHMLA